MFRHTVRKRMQATLQRVKIELRRRMHDPVPEVGKWLKSVVSGHSRYFGVPGSRHALTHFRFTVSNFWHRAMYIVRHRVDEGDFSLREKRSMHT